tara:strand:- start:3565 stop:4440 length:876 start_codon:yes stop_codon:yes gene_type:complete
MKLSKNKLALAIVGAAAIGVASLGTAGISTTKHNLGGADTTKNRVTAGGSNSEICVFCHTPHGSDTSAPVPLWNKQLNTSLSAYQTYDQLGTSSLDGAVASVGSVSLACLSCHDGTQAMDNIINAPGSGGYDATGGGAAGLGFTWADGSSAQSTPNTDGVLGGTGATLTGISTLGVDLRNDHPVGIPYCGGGLYNGGAGTGTCKDLDFKTTTVDSAPVNGVNVFWVETGVADSGRQSTDIPLYTRKTTEASISTEEMFVECASCHDPHSSEVTFLRISNTSSAVCLACHDK